jgi:NAD(P)-dependent dehydrogenase (short-subunit alcohol dehydrogenase family)
MDDLKAKTAVITGASRGIGAAAARVFADLGANVVLLARSADEIGALADEIEAAGGQAIAIACDVARYDDVAAAVEATVARFGRLDILVNNAGLIEPIAHLAQSDPAAWDLVVDVNLKGVYHGLRAALPVMIAQGSGVVVNISSGAATSAMEGWSHYCATKAAVLSLTRCADGEVGDKGVRVVGLSPGTVATHMQVAIRASGINPVSQLDPSVHIPADWVGRAIAWLASDAAADIRGEDFVLREPANRRRVGLPV